MTDPIASCLAAAETDSAADEEEPHPFHFARRAAEDLIDLMGMTGYAHRLWRLAKDNPLSLMKVVFALYRKVRVLAELQDGGKIRF